MTYAVEMGWGAMICIPSFIKTGSRIRKLSGRDGIHRHTGSMGITWSHFYFVELWKVGWEWVWTSSFGEHNPIRPMLWWTRLYTLWLTAACLHITHWMRNSQNHSAAVPDNLAITWMPEDTTQVIQWSLILRLRWRNALSSLRALHAVSMIAIHVWLTWKFSAGHQPV
jgi:hypothetical protein